MSKYFFIADGSTGSWPPVGLFEDLESCKNAAYNRVLEMRNFPPGTEGHPRWVKFYELSDTSVREAGSYSGELIQSWWREREAAEREGVRDGILTDAFQVLARKKKPSKAERDLLDRIRSSLREEQG